MANRGYRWDKLSHGLLRHFAAPHPHVGRLRARRDRRLRPVRPSRRVELWYRSQLGLLVAELRKAGADVAAEYRDRLPAADGRTTATDETKRRPPVVERVAARFGNIKGVADRLAALAARKSLGEVDERLVASIRQSVGVDIGPVLIGNRQIAAAMETATAANVALITSIPEQYLDRVGELVTEAFATGRRFEQLAEDIRHVGDVTASRAKLIARDQVAKMNSSFNEVRQTALGITTYVWSTSHDERVRPSHARLNGETFAWKHPPEVDGENVNPGEAVNCRCVGIPKLDLDEQPAEQPAEQEVQVAA